MFLEWMRKDNTASIIFTVFRVYLGYAWLTAGWDKAMGDFDASGFIKGAIGKASGEHPPVQGWWASILETVVLPNVEIFNFLVAWGEVLVGIALILGLFTTFSALMGITMNFAFLLSGTTSTNPQMVILTIFVLVAGANAGKYGLDRFVLPYVRNMLTRDEKSTPM